MTKSEQYTDRPACRSTGGSPPSSRTRRPRPPASTPSVVWDGLARVVTELAPRNRELLADRDRLQAAIDDWHRSATGIGDPDGYRAFLTELGYLVPAGPALHRSSTAGRGRGDRHASPARSSSCR